MLFEGLEDFIKGSVDPQAAKAQAEGVVLDTVGSPSNPSHDIVTPANIITLCRFVLTTVFLFMFISDSNRYLALSFYAIAAITDFLDGYVARKTNTVSWLGKIMDPIMDRYLLLIGILALYLHGELPLIVIIIGVLRDVYLFVGSLILQRYRRRPVDVVYTGKAATALLMTGFSLLMLDWPKIKGLGILESPWVPGLGAADVNLGLIIVYIGLTLSIIAAVVYTDRGVQIIRESREEEEGA